MHGNAWFMPDWTRSEGKKIINGRDDKWFAIMLIFGMENVFNYASDRMRSEA